MPKGYEDIRDKFIKSGKSRKAAQKSAAKIWNSTHSGKEHVGRGT